MYRSLCLAAAVTAFAPTALSAQALVGTSTFPAAYFVEAQPATAYEMILRLPGFSFDGGDADVRGLAGAGGNVLIDGSRPTTKQDTLETLLRRIPARSVLRIELIRGGSGGIDMGGQAIVANVVRRAEAAVRAQIEGGFGVYSDGRLTPSLSGNVSHRLGKTVSEASIRLERTVDDEKGRGPRVRTNPDGSIRQRLVYDEHDGFRNGALTLGHERNFAGGRLRLSGSFKREREKADTSFASTLPAPGVEYVREIERSTSTEFGLDWKRPLGGGLALELIALKRVIASDATETSEDGSSSQLVGESGDGGETIGRAILRWQPRDGLAIEGGGEAAYNVLDSHASLVANGIAVGLPTADVRVAERRAEGFASATWQVGRKIFLESGLRVEMSRLVQSGDSSLGKSFVFAKPSFHADWSPGHRTKFSVRFDREVGQLDFGDFVSSTSLTSGTITAGNKDLEPDRRLIASLAWERKLWGTGALVLTARHEQISSVVDRVGIIGPGFAFDARGNIGRGTKTRLIANLLLPLERLGLRGGLIKLDAAYRWTSVIDPTTQARRAISGEEPIDGAAHFTLDRPRLGLRGGIDAAFGKDEREYRFDEIRRTRIGTRLSAFLEYRPSAKWTLRAYVDNVTGRQVSRERAIFGGARSSATLRYVELRKLSTGRLTGLIIRRDW